MQLKASAISNNKGVTLVEMMMALALLLISALALMQTALVAMNTTTQNAVRDEAVRIAEQKLNEWRSLDFDSLNNSPGFVNGVYGPVTMVIQIRSFQQTFWVSGGVSNAIIISADPRVPQQKQMTVTVKWPYRGSNYSHSLTSNLRSIPKQ